MSITTATVSGEKKGCVDLVVPIVNWEGVLVIVNQSAVDHTESNAPDPFRTPKLSDSRPGQYWAGGLPGNSKELTAF